MSINVDPGANRINGSADGYDVAGDVTAMLFVGGSDSLDDSLDDNPIGDYTVNEDAVHIWSTGGAGWFMGREQHSVIDRCNRAGRITTVRRIYEHRGVRQTADRDGELD